jgi:acid phosphatase
LAQVPSLGHVVLLVEENQSYSSVIGNSAWPYLNSLASSNGVATQYYGNTHPSIGNYFMMTTGQILTNDDTQTPASFPVSVDNIIRHLLTAGKTWKAYAESLPSAGYTGGNVVGSDNNMYYVRHNPFPYLTDVQNSSTQKMNLVPFTQLATDLANNQLPQFSYIVPDGGHDAHDGTPAQADAWLQQNLPALLASPPFQPGGDGVLFITFDESFTSDTAYGGGQIATVVIGPNVKSGYQSTTLYQHQSLLRTMMEALGITSGFPGAAASAPDMADFFKASATNPPASASGDFQLTASPQNPTATASAGASYQISLTPENGFNGSISLGCSGLPTGTTCSFSPSTVTANQAAATSTLTITLAQTSSVTTVPAGKAKPFTAFSLPIFAIALGSVAAGGGRKKRCALFLALLLIMAFSVVAIGCGSSNGSQAATNSSGNQSSSSSSGSQSSSGSAASTTNQSYNVTITATSGAIQHSTTVALNVQ